MAEFETTEDHGAVARRVLEEIFPACDDAALASVTTDDFVNHELPDDTPPGVAGTSMIMHMLSDAFAEQKWTMHRVLVDGDYVTLHCTHSGRHIGEFFGLPASGRHFSCEQMHIVRMAGGKCAEHWALRDHEGMMRQLSAPDQDAATA